MATSSGFGKVQHETKDPDQPIAQSTERKQTFTIKKQTEAVRRPAEGITCGESCFACKCQGETALARWWCSECEVPFCRRCSQQHKDLPSSKDHHFRKLNTNSKRPLKIKCPQHKEILKFHCKDCKRSVCSTCYSLQHKQCDDVVTLDSVMDDMKSSISQNRVKVVDTLSHKRENVTKLKSRLEAVESRQSTTVSKIRNAEKKTIIFVKEQFQEDVNEVNKRAEEEKFRLKSEIQTAEIEVENLEQHSTRLKEVLEAEDSNDIYKTHELCQSRSLPSQTDSEEAPTKYLVDLDYSLDVERIKQMLSEFGKLKMAFEDAEKCPADESVVLPRPMLIAQITAEADQDEKTPVLTDVAVMTLHDGEAVIVTDHNNCSVKCFYTPSNASSTSHSVCQVENHPQGITILKTNRVMVSVPRQHQLVTLNVTPDLVKEKITTTRDMYWSLAMMDNGQLVASAGLPGRVDVLDVSGNTATRIRTLPTEGSMFASPLHLTLDKQVNDIIVSDWGNGAVTCMTLEGDIRWTFSSPKGTEFFPRGVARTQEGDVIVVDDASHKIIILNMSGTHTTDLLTPEITDPCSVHYNDRGYLYLTDGDKFLVYQMG